MAARQRCASHCSGCGRHFAGDSAFDAHRRGKGDERRCVDPQDCGLEIKREDGTCDLVSPNSVGVTIWQTPAAANPFSASGAQAA